MYCYYKCSVALPHGAMSWSAVCDCGISWSYSLMFWFYWFCSWDITHVYWIYFPILINGTSPFPILGLLVKFFIFIQSCGVWSGFAPFADVPQTRTQGWYRLIESETTLMPPKPGLSGILFWASRFKFILGMVHYTYDGVIGYVFFLILMNFST